MEREFQDAVTVPRVGTNIRLQAVAATPAASSHCHLNENANSRRLECCYRGVSLFPARCCAVFDLRQNGISIIRRLNNVFTQTSNFGFGPRMRDRYLLIIIRSTVLMA